LTSAPLLLLVFLPIQGSVGQSGDCRDQQVSVITTVRELLLRGDQTRAQQAMDAPPGDDPSCAPLQLMRHALSGWFAARALAATGAAPGGLPPVREMIDRIGAVTALAPAAGQRPDVLRLQVEYAQTLINAAIAAAQDERPEMELLLDHARDLVQRVEQRGDRALWPRPFNLAAGELWFEVDRFEDARAAYERAVQGEPSAAALVGLARALARLGRSDAACAAYDRARDVALELRTTAKADLARCQ
jgi:tetratricopeptide (TPR) repeat protein